MFTKLRYYSLKTAIDVPLILSKTITGLEFNVRPENINSQYKTSVQFFCFQEVPSINTAVIDIIFIPPPNIRSKIQEKVLLWKPLGSKVKRLVAGNRQSSVS